MRDLNRRQFLSVAPAAEPLFARSALAASAALPRLGGASADHTIRTGTGPIEAAPDKTISATTYNGRFREVEVGYAANQPGLSSFHCHQQLHRDFGFMALLECS